ncbi:MAG: hypothetical protein ACOZCP_03100 [Pseudomonadota bacterium]
MQSFENAIARVLEQSRLYFGLSPDGSAAYRAADEGWGERRIEDRADGGGSLSYQLLSRPAPGIDFRACA